MSFEDPDDIEPVRIGERIESRYTILSRIGEGGMGVVYLAQDEKDERYKRRVALKFPKKELQYKKGFRSRFAAEIRSLMEIEHVNVVRVYDVGSHNGTPFMVLQYLEGGTLAQRIEKNGSQSLQEVLSWLPRIAEALDAMHRHGIVHRDVKAMNILFDKHGQPLVSDFGIAKVLVELKREQGTATAVGVAMGSPESLAPEYVHGNYSGAYDQYGLATAVYQALSGKLPFAADSQLELRLATTDAIPLHLVAPQISTTVSAVIMRALAKEPLQRFRSCAEFAAALTTAAVDRFASPPPPETPPVPQPPAAPPPPTPPNNPGPQLREQNLMRRLGWAILLLAFFGVFFVWLSTIRNQSREAAVAPPPSPSALAAVAVDVPAESATDVADPPPPATATEALGATGESRASASAAPAVAEPAQQECREVQVPVWVRKTGPVVIERSAVDTAPYRARNAAREQFGLEVFACVNSMAEAARRDEVRDVRQLSYTDSCGEVVKRGDREYAVTCRLEAVCEYDVRTTVERTVCD